MVFVKGKFIGLTVQVGNGFFVEPDKIATNIHVIASAPIIKFKVLTAKQYEIEKVPIYYRVSETVKNMLSQLFRSPFKDLKVKKNGEPEQSRVSKERTVYTIEGVTAHDDKNDLVLLKATETGIPLPFGNSDGLQNGEPVYIVGYDDKEYKATGGNILSGHNSDKQLLIKAELPPNSVKGHSGGPVLNSKGEVIGVVVAGTRLPSDSSVDTHSLVAAIPLTVCRTLVENSEQIEPLVEWQNRPRVRAYVKEILGNSECRAGKYEKAIVYYDDALRLNPSLVEVYYNRGNAKDHLGDTKGAIEDYDNAIRLNPEHANAYCNRGNAKDHLGDTKGAIEDYDNAIRLNSEHTYAYNNRGNAKDYLGDTKGAIEDYDNAIRLSPEDASTYYNRGLAKKALGQQEAAEADFEKAKALDPDIENKS